MPIDSDLKKRGGGGGRRGKSKMSSFFEPLPFCLCPQQVWAQNDRDVAGCHLVHVAVLRKLCEKFDQVPATKRTGCYASEAAPAPC